MKKIAKKLKEKYARRALFKEEIKQDRIQDRAFLLELLNTISEENPEGDPIKTYKKIYGAKDGEPLYIVENKMIMHYMFLKNRGVLKKCVKNKNFSDSSN